MSKAPTLDERLKTIEVLLGLRNLDDPALERLRFEQAAYAGKLLKLSSAAFSQDAFLEELLSSYARGWLERLNFRKSASDQVRHDCDQCQEKSE